MCDNKNEILEEAIFSLEVEGFKVSEEEKQLAREMLEGKRNLNDIIRECIAKGTIYTEV